MINNSWKRGKARSTDRAANAKRRVAAWTDSDQSGSAKGSEISVLGEVIYIKLEGRK